MRQFGPLVLLAAAACTPTAAEQARIDDRNAGAQQQLAEELAGLTPGEPMTCIDQNRTWSTTAYGPTILYRVSRDLVYRTDTAGGCENIGRGDTLVTRTPTTRLCRGDIAQTFEPVARVPTGSCSFGDFVPYRRR